MKRFAIVLAGLGVLSACGAPAIPSSEAIATPPALAEEWLYFGG